MAIVAPTSSLFSNLSYHGDDGPHLPVMRMQENRRPVPTTPGGHTRQNGVSKGSLTVAGKGRRRNSSSGIGAKGAQNSLRRVNDSTDMLPQRSLRRQQTTRETPPEGSTGAREGRNFTVANVGNNGMIYLRSVWHSIYHSACFATSMSLWRQC